MLGIVGIIALLTALGLSLVVTRIATAALVLTGLSEEVAKFQARSAFTGTGFTTAEAEQVVAHPVRRRIIVALFVLRSAGLLTIVLSLILSFVGPAPDMQKLIRLLWIAGGIAGLWILSASRLGDRQLGRLIRWALRRWTDLDVRDYVDLLHLSGPYAVSQLHVRRGDWIEGRRLRQCRLRQEGLLVLGIQRGEGDYVGAPHGDTRIEAGDTLILYGRDETLEGIDRRRAGATGESAHAEAVGQQRRQMRRQHAQESARQRRKEAGL